MIYNDKTLLIIIIIIIYLVLLLLIIYYQLFETDDLNKYNRTIQKDGYKVFDHDDKNIILKYLPNNYLFINYKYEIKGCTLSTFHRDVTSSQYIYKTKYPVYTLITYYNSGPLLTICPDSHTTTPFLLSSPVIIYGNPKTSILFNCDIVHAGAINNFGIYRHAIQYKICHYDDLFRLQHLIGIDKISYGKCNNSHDNYVYILRKISLFFSYIVNHLFTDLLQKKPKKDSISDFLINNFFIGDFYNS